MLFLEISAKQSFRKSARRPTDASMGPVVSKTLRVTFRSNVSRSTKFRPSPRGISRMHTTVPTNFNWREIHYPVIKNPRRGARSDKRTAADLWLVSRNWACLILCQFLDGKYSIKSNAPQANDIAFVMVSIVARGRGIQVKRTLKLAGRDVFIANPMVDLVGQRRGSEWPQRKERNKIQRLPVRYWLPFRRRLCTAHPIYHSFKECSRMDITPS